MKKSYLKTALASLCLITLVGIFSTFVLLVSQSSQTEALTVNSFNAGNILGDTVMTNKSSMTVTQIQQFLNSKVPTCDTLGRQISEFGAGDANDDGYSNTQTDIGLVDDNKDGVIQRWEWGKFYYDQTTFPCLKGYVENSKTAAQIIYDTAQAQSINPQVILVLLQKEQALVTDTWPLNIQYRSATGFGCPDTAACDSTYYGFTNQVWWAATMFRSIMDASPNWYTPYVLGNNYIQYNPVTSCGGSVVNIQNRATQALYNYTPYQPNSATLEWKFNDGAFPSCGAFGNLNFFVYFSEWFGSTQGVSVIPVRLNSSTDSTGEQATVGFKLSHQPTSNVIIPVAVSSVSNARVASGASITITPSTWDQPEKNKVTIVGLNNPDLNGTHNYSLVTGRVQSYDVRYASLSGDQIDDIQLVQQNVSQPRNVYRLYSETTGQHYFTSSQIERNDKLSAGWRDEGISFSYCEAGEQTIHRLVKPNTDKRVLVVEGTDVYSQAINNGYVFESVSFSTSTQGSIPVYWRYNEATEDSLYTTSPTEGISQGFIDKGIAFNTCGDELSVVYRMYDEVRKIHFFTASPDERDKALYLYRFRYENAGYYVNQAGAQEVYRLYRKSTNSHFYTASAAERDSAVSRDGFVYEGVVFHTNQAGAQEVYRLYRKSTNSHFYTTSAAERDSAVSQHDFVYEGVVFKAN